MRDTEGFREFPRAMLSSLTDVAVVKHFQNGDVIVEGAETPTKTRMAEGVSLTKVVPKLHLKAKKSPPLPHIFLFFCGPRGEGEVRIQNGRCFR